MNIFDIVEIFIYNLKYLGRNINFFFDFKYVVLLILINYVIQRGLNGVNVDFDMYVFYNDLEGINFGEKVINVQKSIKFINRKLKELDIFDGNKVEWNDYVCYFE